MLNLTVPDSTTIDIVRGTVIGVGILLMAGIATIRFAHNLPKRARGGMTLMLMLTAVLIATEVQQLGEPMVVWRLPSTGIAFLCGLYWITNFAADLREEADKRRKQ